LTKFNTWTTLLDVTQEARVACAPLSALFGGCSTEEERNETASPTADLAIDLGFQKLSAPSNGGPGHRLARRSGPCGQGVRRPATPERFSPFEITIKWGFKETVGFLQQRLLDDQQFGLREHMALYRFLAIVTIRHL
jgi:hypothetical protein